MRHPISTLVLSLSGLFACAVATLAAEQRPNILFCFADDWGRYARAYDAADGGRPSPNQVVTTPSVDRVAKEGVLFRHAYVNAPSCTPCRSALLSGRYFFATGLGAILQRAEWDSSIPTWPLLLRDAGYHIGKMYKVWSPGTPADAGYGGQEHGYEKAGRDFNQFSQNVTKLVEGGMPVEEAKQKMYAQVQANFEAFLAARQGDKPFAFWFGPTNTHRKWTRGSGKALWNIDPDALKGKLPKFLPDVPEIREDFADYLGEAQAFDAADFPSLDAPAPAGTPAVGSLLRQLDAELPPGVALTVIVPATLQGADAERAALSRAVTWQVVEGAMPPSSAKASPTPSLAIRHLAGDEHALRYLRAAARAWRPNSAPAVQIGTTDAPLPPPSQPLVWLAPGPVPAPVMQFMNRRISAVSASPSESRSAIRHAAIVMGW